MRPSWLRLNALELAYVDQVGAAIIELGRHDRGVVGHGGGVLKLAAAIEVNRDPGGAEGMVPDLGFNGGRITGPRSRGRPFKITSEKVSLTTRFSALQKWPAFARVNRPTEPIVCARGLGRCLVLLRQAVGQISESAAGENDGRAGLTLVGAYGR